MSFLSLLLFCSAFYFVYGRPDATATAEALAGTYPAIAAEASPPDSKAADQYIEKIGEFMKVLNDALDEYLSPLLSKLDKDKQDLMKARAANVGYSFINSLILMANEDGDENGTKSDVDKYSEDKKDDITLEFVSLGPVDPKSAFIPEQRPASTMSETKTEVVNKDQGTPAVSSSMLKSEEP